ncbi:MAG: NAD(P)/FAD-dependent oxidoreductase, partial [Candidatus Thorarchaeota archaeon]|nr:NAD(P)/FAD-dependent oxidoreductase [Candidatus Thorarchaeota archaeon]
MTRKSIIIIGAGLAGLATGCYAQINGYESQIFEHHSKPGGVAAAWRRGAFLVDAGIHFVICHKPGTSIYDVYSEVGAFPSTTVKDMTAYLRFVDQSGNTLIEFTEDLAKLEQDMVNLSPEDEKEIHDFIKEVNWMKDSPLLTDLGMSTAPPELRGRFSSLREMWEMRSFMKYFTGKFSKSAAIYAKRFHDPVLQSVFSYAFSPDAPVWFVIMILATIAAGQLGLLTKGCPDFVESIVERYKS